MKKILCCLVLAFAQTAASAAVLDVQVSLRQVRVSVTETDGAEIPTLQLLDKDKTAVLYSNDGRLKAGEYVFDDFSFPQDAATGDYVVRVGENGKITEKVISYVSYDETVEILKRLSAGESAAELIGKNPAMFGTTAAEVAKLGEAWAKRLDSDIAALDIKCDTDEEIRSSYSDISAALKKIIVYAKLTSANSEDIKAAIAALDGIDTKYMEKIVQPSELAKAFAAQGIDVMTADDAAMLKAFDGAVLVTVINSCDWGMGKDALGYYTGKGLLSIDAKYLSAGADTYKTLKSKQILDYTKLPDAIKAAYSSGSGSDGGTGGGGGSSSGGTNVGKSNPPSGMISGGTTAKTPTFDDLDGAEWAREAIEALAARNIVSGRENGKFAPNDNLTRAEFVKLIVDAFGIKDTAAAAEFSDVPAGSWSYVYVASAKKAGVVSGRSDTVFGASEPISRQDMAVILLRIADFKGISLGKNAAEFTDNADISDYAKDAVAALAGAGVISGMGDGSFMPASNVTRAQGARVIWSMLNR